jgi:hypothetical protein
MQDTQFRHWMKQLNQAAGNRVGVPEWPRLISLMLCEKHNQEVAIDRPYAGQQILIDRTSHNWEEATVPEKRAVYGLYQHCLKQSDSVLAIGDDEYLLLSYEVPNQGSHKGRRADLVGLNKDGGLVVFEAKVAGNSYGPVAALLEGLDYLSALSGVTNIQKMQDEFTGWMTSLKNAGYAIPNAFQNVSPSVESRCEVIVFATPEYFEQYDATARGAGWQDLSRLSTNDAAVSMRFAKCEIDAQGAFANPVEWCH